MRPRRRVGLVRLDSLGTRLAALLSLALLPLGLIAVVQTYRALDQAAQKTEAALLGETLLTLRSERGLIQKKIGVAEAAAATVLPLRADPAACSAFMRNLVRSSPEVLVAVMVPPSGKVSCASQGAGADFSDWPELASAMQEPRARIRVMERGRISGLPTILVSAPVLAPDGEMLGYVTLSIDHTELHVAGEAEVDGLKPLDLLTFNSDGDVLTSRLGTDGAADRLPTHRALKALAGGEPAVFRDVNAAGERRIYTVTPLAEGAVHAMAVWPPSAGVGQSGVWRWAVPTVGLPLMMWAASLGVAIFAVHRLVIRHVRRLRKRMRLFSRFRRIEEDPEDDTLPTELAEVSDSFVRMAHTILRDEAEQENSLREKDALLREVYHRVRNNLQLIASINNMQIRASRAPEAKHVLRRLQDRIMALATIHGALYEADALSKVRVDPLVDELATQIIAKAKRADPAIEVRTKSVPLMLHPDQAVPLALLVVEALTNAVKHLGRPAHGDAPVVSVTLAEEADGAILIAVENSVGQNDVLDFEGRAHEGLGMQLMDAFAIQLGGEKRIAHQNGLYRVTVRFAATDYDGEAAIA